jgi:hypothetical protein
LGEGSLEGGYKVNANTELLVRAARQQLDEAYEAAKAALEVLILSTPTGDERNRYCDAQIHLGTMKELAYDKPTDDAACICETHGHPIEKRWQHDRWCPQYLEPADESANPQGGG